MTKSRNINQPRMVWTDWHEAIVLATYAHTANAALCKIFGCTSQQLYSFAGRIGIKKSQWFWKKHPASKTTVFSKTGSHTRFVKGHITHNKGRKGLYFAGSEKGWFKTGTKPPNVLPVGHIRKMPRERYYEVKISDTGHKPTDWVPIHRLIWQRLTGKPVPKDHVIIYADGNHENTDISNLQCWSKAENMKRNSVHAYGPGIAKIYQLRGQISRQINKRKNQHEHSTNPIQNAV